MRKKKTKITIETPWEGIPDSFSPEDYQGFVYLIVNRITGRKYIGKKFFWSTRKTKVRGKKRKQRLTKESDWKTYISSSDELKQEIAQQGIKPFQFIILSLHKTKALVNYNEVKEQFARDVLYSTLPNGEYEYLNKCILNRYYRLKNV